MSRRALIHGSRNTNPLLALASGGYDPYDYGGHDNHGYHDYSYGHHGHGGGYHDCCPLVVDPKAYIAMMAFMAAAVYFFQQLIAMSMLVMPGRKKRSIWHVSLEGTMIFKFVRALSSPLLYGSCLYSVEVTMNR